MFNRTRSGLTRERLDDLLRAFRNIARLDDANARRDLDKVLAELRSEFDGAGVTISHLSRDRGHDQLDSLRDRIESLRARTAAKSGDLVQSAAALNDFAGIADQWLDPTVRAELSEDFEALRTEAAGVALEAAVTGHLLAIEAAQTDLISNVASVQRIVRNVDEAVKGLAVLGATDSRIAAGARAAKVRAARFRAQKRLNEADVAAVGGNTKKADKLRAEAGVLLRQDWALVFPGESPPSE